VWIDQRSLLPMRLILPAAPDSWGDPALDIRFQSWRETDAVWYPWHILFYRDDRLERELKISRVEKDPPLPEDFFDLARLKRRYQATTPAAPVSEQPPSGGDVQKTLDDFKRFLTDVVWMCLENVHQPAGYPAPARGRRPRRRARGPLPKRSRNVRCRANAGPRGNPPAGVATGA
jgi:hypothetical protein